MTRQGHNLVLQLNFPISHNRELLKIVGEEEARGEILDAHPVAQGREWTLAWARLDIDLETGEALVEEQFPGLIVHYAAAIAVHSRLYPGAEEAVRGLRDAGYRVAICTNKPEALAVDLIEALGVTALFDALIGADTLPVRKPDPEPLRQAVARAGGALEQSLLLGDTQTDYDTARAAGVPIVLVSFGQEAEVASLTPEAHLADFAELQHVVETLLG
jgi:phosphoglycolate phosphatase